jgi:hypothetical protein
MFCKNLHSRRIFRFFRPLDRSTKIIEFFLYAIDISLLGKKL